MASDSTNGVFNTRILPVEGSKLGYFKSENGKLALDNWNLYEPSSENLKTLRYAAQLLRESNVPVAFPTETVYGLGADATRSEAVKGIYKTKGRPSDNPLIIHVSDLDMLRNLLVAEQTNGHVSEDSIPAIYRPLIDRFWPGPLTILLPNPEGSQLAPEVTAGLKTFGARMPNSPLALSLIHLAGGPIAAPSANASTKPSTTTAQHVLHDLNGRIEVILDGGSSDVGVESTIVDGLCSPPLILRPGGLSINSIRKCEGWESVQKAYKDEFESGGDTPRAPGMKYKHYSPRAKVVLVERGALVMPKNEAELLSDLSATNAAQNCDLNERECKGFTANFRILGIVRTRKWAQWGGMGGSTSSWARIVPTGSPLRTGTSNGAAQSSLNIEALNGLRIREGQLYSISQHDHPIAKIIDVDLGKDTKAIAHGLFAALRELDTRGVDLIYVEGIEDGADVPHSLGGAENREKEEAGDIAAAVMNRLRKAASIIK